MPPGNLETPTTPPVGDGQPNRGVPRQRPATPPTVTVSQIPWPSILLAVGTLALSGAAMIVLVRRGRAAGPHASVGSDALADLDAISGFDASGSSARTLAAMIATGETMIDGGYPVDRVQHALEDIARVNGESAAQIITFPTAVLVSLRAGSTVQTAAVSTGRASLLLFQLEALDTAVQEARRGALAPAALLTRVRSIRRLEPPFGFVQRLIAYVVLSIGLSMLLGASWAGLALAGVLGGLVGTLMLLGSRIPLRYRALLTVAAAFVASVVAFLVVRADLDPGMLPSLVAPLVMRNRGRRSVGRCDAHPVGLRRPAARSCRPLVRRRGLWCGLGGLSVRASTIPAVDFAGVVCRLRGASDRGCVPGCGALGGDRGTGDDACGGSRRSATIWSSRDCQLSTRVLAVGPGRIRTGRCHLDPGRRRGWACDPDNDDLYHGRDYTRGSRRSRSVKFAFTAFRARAKFGRGRA